MVIALVGGTGSACSVKNGTGELHGSLNVPGCSFSNGIPQPLKYTPPYSQNLEFFAGVPFDSTTPRFPANQVSLRMQPSSTRLEFADALKFWVRNSYEVGRCIRGRVNPDGTPDWDLALCDRSVLGPSGEGRLFVGTEDETVTSAFVLFYTCPQALPSAVALGSCAGGSCPDVAVCPGRGSWIAFSEFGSALPPGNLPPPKDELRSDFKIQNGEPIEASAFHIELCDHGTVDAVLNREFPIPTPAITGMLDGSFRFALQPGLY
jgi:hypothetical protein